MYTLINTKIKAEFIWSEDDFLKLKQYAVEKVNSNYDVIFDNAFYCEKTKKYHLIANKLQYKIIKKIIKKEMIRNDK